MAIIARKIIARIIELGGSNGGGNPPTYQFQNGQNYAFQDGEDYEFN